MLQRLNYGRVDHVTSWLQNYSPSPSLTALWYLHMIDRSQGLFVFTVMTVVFFIIKLSSSASILS